MAEVTVTGDPVAVSSAFLSSFSGSAIRKKTAILSSHESV